MIAADGRHPHGPDETVFASGPPDRLPPVAFSSTLRGIPSSSSTCATPMRCTPATSPVPPPHPPSASPRLFRNSLTVITAWRSCVERGAPAGAALNASRSSASCGRGARADGPARRLQHHPFEQAAARLPAPRGGVVRPHGRASARATRSPSGSSCRPAPCPSRPTRSKLDPSCSLALNAQQAMGPAGRLRSKVQVARGPATTRCRRCLGGRTRRRLTESVRLPRSFEPFSPRGATAAGPASASHRPRVVRGRGGQVDVSSEPARHAFDVLPPVAGSPPPPRPPPVSAESARRASPARSGSGSRCRRASRRRARRVGSDAVGLALALNARGAQVEE